MNLAGSNKPSRIISASHWSRASSASKINKMNNDSNNVFLSSLGKIPAPIPLDFNFKQFGLQSNKQGIQIIKKNDRLISS